MWAPFRRAADGDGAHGWVVVYLTDDARLHPCLRRCVSEEAVHLDPGPRTALTVEGNALTPRLTLPIAAAPRASEEASEELAEAAEAAGEGEEGEGGEEAAVEAAAASAATARAISLAVAPLEGVDANEIGLHSTLPHAPCARGERLDPSDVVQAASSECFGVRLAVGVFDQLELERWAERVHHLPSGVSAYGQSAATLFPTAATSSGLDGSEGDAGDAGGVASASTRALPPPPPPPPPPLLEPGSCVGLNAFVRRGGTDGPPAAGDLIPYLGMGAHGIVASADGERIWHVHFAAPSDYVGWAQEWSRQPGMGGVVADPCVMPVPMAGLYSHSTLMGPSLVGSWRAPEQPAAYVLLAQ